jgi:hypothetical protein
MVKSKKSMGKQPKMADLSLALTGAGQAVVVGEDEDRGRACEG